MCGLSEPTGVIATDDIGALIALEPDCVVYTAQGGTWPMEAIDQLSKFLATGINMAATSMVWPAVAAPDWPYPPDNQVGVHRVVIEEDPRVEPNTHGSHPVLDSTEAGCISTAARVVNAIDWICRAPKGLIAVEDVPQAEVIRGLMW